MKTFLLFGLLAALAVCVAYLCALKDDLRYERELNSIRMETAAKAQQGVGKGGDAMKRQSALNPWYVILRRIVFLPICIVVISIAYVGLVVGAWGLRKAGVFWDTSV